MTRVSILRAANITILIVIIYATGFDSNFIPFPIIGRTGVTLAEKFGANESNNFQMTRPRSLRGIHVEHMPNFYMMVGPQSLNPVTNITVLCEQQAKYIRDLLVKMQDAGHSRIEPSSQAVEEWIAKCTQSVEGKVWLRCNNWYLKTTKTPILPQEENDRRACGWRRTKSTSIMS
jgi:cation diffusion facilitator CzcD-associated flavoprotein CzcO